MVGAMPVNLIPKFCNGAMDSHNTSENDDIQVQIGSRIKCIEHFATVKYIGEIQGYKGIWYGVEWDEVSRGKHDGSVDGIQYFKTSKPGAGSFIRPNKIEPLTTCAEAIKKYYGDREDETIAAHRTTVINEWKREMGAPFIKMVGFEKIHQKQKLDRLVDVCISNHNVATSGDVSSLCPRVTSVDLSRNLFSNWREVIAVCGQWPRLSNLNISNNRMAIDIPEETLEQLSIHCMNLEKVNISHCDYEWQDLLSLSHLWPKIDEIIAAYNRITTISFPTLTLNTLSTLWLDGNPLRSFEEVLYLGSMRNLRMLSLNECDIMEIRFSDVPAKVDMFCQLEMLFLNRNLINDWRSLSELGKLKSLKKLYFLRNPVQSTEDYDTGSQLIIAKIGTLQELNGSQIRPEFRRGAEYDYMKRYGADWKLAQDDDMRKMAFDVEHPRFEELVKKYGIPEDSLLVKQIKHTTLTSQLLKVKLADENGTSFEKKFPSTMVVQKLVTLAQRLFTKHGHRGIPQLFCVDKQNTERELNNYMKELAFYSIESGDTILVRFR